MGFHLSLSGSESSQTSNTENIDMRVVGGDGSQNLSARDSNISIIATDHGAVTAGMNLGTAALTANERAVRSVLDTGEGFFQGALNTVTSSQKSAVGAISSANERLALAYQSGQAGDQTTLKYAGFIVIGLAAVMIFGKK